MQIISDGSEENLKNLMAMKKVLYFLVATREFGEKHDKGVGVKVLRIILRSDLN